MVFKRSSKGRVLIQPIAIQKMEDHKQSFWGDEPESGGILLGRWLKSSDDVIIDDVTIPGPRDTQKRRRFFRFRGDHEPFLHKAWEESSGSTDYLGEWHTHPDSHPTPSRLDRRVWENFLQHHPNLFFIIWGFRRPFLWEGEWSDGVPKINPLKRINT